MSSLNITQGTQSAINFDLNGTINTQVIAVGYGTISTIGTLPTITIGTIGTLGLGSVVVNTLPNLPGGSIVVTTGTITSIGTIGTLGLGTITGNLGTIGTVGTLQGLGTLPGVGVITSLTNGSINIPNGTLQALGTMGTLGTLQNQGSLTNLGQLYNAGTVQNQLAGTITALQNGTINKGTMNVGTLSPIPSIAVSTYGTHGTTGVSIFGTLAGGTGAGAGTEIFITSLSLTIPSTGGSQDASIGWGSNGGTFHAGTGLLVRGNFPPGGGIQKQFCPPVNSGTNGQLMLFQAGAGTVDVSVSYFITASTL